MNRDKINRRVPAGAHYNKGRNHHTEALGPIPLTVATDTVALTRSDPTIFMLSRPDLQSTGKS